jgi:hypothetical protein
VFCVCVMVVCSVRDVARDYVWLDIMNTTFLLRYLHIMLCVCLLNQVARYNM